MGPQDKLDVLRRDALLLEILFDFTPITPLPTGEGLLFYKRIIGYGWVKKISCKYCAIIGIFAAIIRE
jgi:hypothetical protein